MQGPSNMPGALKVLKQLVWIAKRVKITMVKGNHVLPGSAKSFVPAVGFDLGT